MRIREIVTASQTTVGVAEPRGRILFSLAQRVYAWDESAAVSASSPIYGASRRLEATEDEHQRIVSAAFELVVD